VRTRAIALAAAILAAGPGTAAARTPPPDAPPSPVAIADPFAIPWTFDSRLACMTCTNTSDRVMTAVRFGLTY